jgi:glucose-1-phosphate cytidylyltransferase
MQGAPASPTADIPRIFATFSIDLLRYEPPNAETSLHLHNAQRPGSAIFSIIPATLHRTRKIGTGIEIDMKAVILAGGLGTRLSEETVIRPKPMVEIGGRPILWHILKIYSSYGINDFVICCGYKGYMIKEYFANYFLHMSDVTIDLRNNNTEVHQQFAEPWRITLVDTGEETMTGGRLKRVREYVADEDFCFTYGDGVSDINIAALIDHHSESGLLATLTAIQPPGRFGVLNLEGSLVRSFQEKPDGDGSWINGGFFVLSPDAIDYVQDDSTIWERKPMERLALEGQLGVYFHDGFWHPMDTLRDRHYLDRLWQDRQAPWAVWK